MRKPHAALATPLLAAMTVAACDSDDVLEVTSTVTATGTLTPTDLLARDAEEFRIFPDAAQFANGTARVEREGHWFEVDPTGQFSSDRF